MRIVHWLFVVSMALFVSAIGFIIAGARSVRAAPAVEAPAVRVSGVASVKQIMNGISKPAAQQIFDAVRITVTAKGMEEIAPHTDAEWEALGNAAASLAESGNLLLLGGRAVDPDDWAKMSQAMIEAGRITLKAVEAKDPDQVLAAGEAVNASCDSCHLKYKRG